MNDKNKPLIGFFLLIIIIALTLFQKDNNYNQIMKEDTTVIGKVTEYHFSNYAYTLYYEYVVNNVKYEETTSTLFFKCNDGTRGCVGKEFTIYYSVKDPSNSIIDLGEYNKFKNH